MLITLLGERRLRLVSALRQSFVRARDEMLSLPDVISPKLSFEISPV
jgi:hypothetical protein